MNALAAILYIAAVASVMFYGGKFSGPVNSVIAPMAVVSLFTLSAAVMGYVLLYQPFQLYFDGKKKLAIGLFFKTLAIFAAVTILTFVWIFARDWS